ncbi:VOC family protein [Corynebacterium variabile]|uniref:bleomycin resistance protein n=1 Tax=Corynebacterium variabile TaxID=1727 RepID=UPI002FE14E3B
MAAPRRPANLVAAACVLPVTDVDRSIEHYRALGFEVAKLTDEYAMAQRGDTALHLSLMPELDPLKGAGCVYLYVDDADGLAQEWVEAGVGRTVAPVDTDYGLREGAHVDPDNNLLRFGADIAG